jgi:uncharacterized protein (TIGR03437 family)
MDVKTRLFLVMFALLAPRLAVAQGTISTVAGGSGFLDNVPATEARLDGPQGLAVDAQGNAYIGDGMRIRRVDAKTGIISTVAGGATGVPANGPATTVVLGGPMVYAFDAAGNLVFQDGLRVMKLDFKAGMVTTIAGVYDVVTPQFGGMTGVATDRAGDIFITDGDYDKIYRIDAVTQAVTLIAGTGSGPGPAGDGGPATQATLDRPGAIVLDASGNIFFAEQYDLRRIDGRTGIVTTIMPVIEYGAAGDGGPVSKAALENPTALATDSQGNLYIADGPRVRKIDWSTGIISAVAGSGQLQYTTDGVPALQANLSFMTGLTVDGAGNIWLADQGNSRLFIIPAATGLIRTVAGTSANGDGGPALGALLNYPSGVALNSLGDLFISQSQTNSIRRVDHTTGAISTVAQFTRNGVIAEQIAVDTAGNIFVALTDRISRVDAISGNVTTVAGGNGQGFSGDGGAATAAQLSPSAVAVDAAGDLYIADYWNYRIRRVDAKSGIITTIAGNGQTTNQDYNGATGPATQIMIGVPTGIAVSPAGDAYWSTAGRVLSVDSHGMLSIVAGNGGCLYAGDGGSALLASLCQPIGLAFDTDGNLFVGEVTCGCVRRIDAATGLIQTVAGTGTPGTSGDSIPATRAALNVEALAVAGSSLYISDWPASSTNARIRMVSPAIPPAMPQPPRITAAGNGVDYRSTYSPGAIVSIMGNYLASPVPASAQLGSDGRVTTALAGDVVTFNGTAGPLLYVSAAQINTVVPYGTAPKTASVQVQTGAGTDTTTLSVSQTSLALFTGLVFNPDGSMNGAANPAPKGATLVLYGTGMGQTSPPGVDGAILQGPVFPQPAAQFSATVDNGSEQLPATISYLGPLPDFIAGAMQVNVRMPDSAPPGQSSLVLRSLSGDSITLPQTIYLLSDPPVLTGITPASPIPQTLGSGTYLTLNGTDLNKITTVNFFFGGSPVSLQQQMFEGCTATACTVFVYFAGQTGDYEVEVVNAANQASNLLTFTVQPLPPPAVTSVTQADGTTPLVATKSQQFVTIEGSNFETPLSVDFYYNGSLIATLSSTNPAQIFDVTNSLMQVLFDFQGNAGQYGVDVVCPGGVRSALFNFTVLAP